METKKPQSPLRLPCTRVEGRSSSAATYRCGNDHLYKNANGICPHCQTRGARQEGSEGTFTKALSPNTWKG